MHRYLTLLPPTTHVEFSIDASHSVVFLCVYRIIRECLLPRTLKNVACNGVYQQPEPFKYVTLLIPAHLE